MFSFCSGPDETQPTLQRHDKNRKAAVSDTQSNNVSNILSRVQKRFKIVAEAAKPSQKNTHWVRRWSLGCNYTRAWTLDCQSPVGNKERNFVTFYHSRAQLALASVHGSDVHEGRMLGCFTICNNKGLFVSKLQKERIKVIWSPETAMVVIRPASGRTVQSSRVRHPGRCQAGPPTLNTILKGLKKKT